MLPLIWKEIKYHNQRGLASRAVQPGQQPSAQTPLTPAPTPTPEPLPLAQSKGHSQHIISVLWGISLWNHMDFYHGSTCFSSRGHLKSLGHSHTDSYSGCLSVQIPKTSFPTHAETRNYQQAAKVWAEMEASSPQPTLWENILREKLQCLCPLARLSAGTAPLLTAHNDPVRKWIKSVHLSIWLLFSPHQHCGLIFYRNCIILYNTTEAQNDLGWKGP